MILAAHCAYRAGEGELNIYCDFVLALAKEEEKTTHGMSTRKEGGRGQKDEDEEGRKE